MSLLRLRFAALGWLLVMAACGGGGGEDSSTDTATKTCSDGAQKSWVLGETRDWYLFQDLLPPSVDPDDYADAGALLDALTATARAQGKDRYFSYVTTQTADEARFQGQSNAGFGFRLGLTLDDRLFLLEVFEGAPAADSGMARGTEVLAIDAGSGYRSIARWIAEDRSLSSALGPAEEGVQRGFRFRGAPASAVVEEVLVKRSYDIDPIPDDSGVSTLPLAGTVGVGYLNFRSFVSTADTQLPEVFAGFRAQGLSDFIIDLRYNGGGLVSTEETFENQLAAELQNLVSHRLEFNEDHADSDETTRFAPGSAAVTPLRLVFITTGSTASASELLINSLKPYMQVAIVGADTYGKPVGQIARDMEDCDTRLRLIAFRTVNVDGEGDYYNGLADTLPQACAAADDIFHAQGDPVESSTATALSWLSTGACATSISAAEASAAAKRERAGMRLVPGPRPLEWAPGAN